MLKAKECYGWRYSRRQRCGDFNPDLHIATLASGARLHMRIFANRGRGYVQADRNKRDDQPIGVIPVDSIYTPITRVNYSCGKYSRRSSNEL